MIGVRVQQARFDAGVELDAFTAGVPGAGAIVSFTGLVRDVAGGLQHMQIEHYPGMTESAITEIATQAGLRWSLRGAVVIHRFGTLPPGDPIMMVATAAPHRADAFAAADFLMDYLKSRAPFWKKEVTATEGAWVDAKASDEESLDRWR